MNKRSHDIFFEIVDKSVERFPRGFHGCRQIFGADSYCDKVDAIYSMASPGKYAKFSCFSTLLVRPESSFKTFEMTSLLGGKCPLCPQWSRWRYKRSVTKPENVGQSVI